MKIDSDLIRANLLAVFDEVRTQGEVGSRFPSARQGFTDQIDQMREWIEDANEFGTAYESLVSMLEEFPFLLSSQAAVKLLEVGLVMRFKTDLVSDALFDSR